MSKADYPLLCGWASSNQLKAWIKQKGQPSYKQERIPLAWQPLNWDISLFSLTSNANWNISSSWIPRMPAFKLELYRWLSRFSVLQACTRTKPSVLLGHQIAKSICSSWDEPASLIMWSKFLIINISPSLPPTSYIYAQLLLFLWRTLRKLL